MDRKRLLRNPLIWIVVFFLVYLGVSSLFSDTRGFTQAPTSLALTQVTSHNVASTASASFRWPHSAVPAVGSYQSR